LTALNNPYLSVRFGDVLEGLAAMGKTISYREAGVDIEAGDAFVRRIKGLVESTFRSLSEERDGVCSSPRPTVLARS